MKVLLVEDDSALCDVLARNLSARGHTVVTADTAEGAILQMVEDWPDVLVLDVNLPDYSAWEVLRRLGEESRRRLRVIVTSAYPISQKRIDEFRPHSALQKPFPVSALLHAVENGTAVVVQGE
ncbi:MAG TPA: response regulator [Dehalococcoidia bacterium]|nr:response regulator [Dehalococcoidia bacterium]